jgi:hypothetical protein
VKEHSKRRLTSIGILAALVLCTAVVAQSSPELPVVGTWEGDSVCQVPKPCTTEHVIYEIKGTDAAKITISADKVVDGKRLWMGDIGCQWKAETKRLSCPMEGRRPADWEFTLAGDTLTGTLIIREGNVLFRKITVKKIKP